MRERAVSTATVAGAALLLLVLHATGRIPPAPPPSESIARTAVQAVPGDATVLAEINQEAGATAKERRDAYIRRWAQAGEGAPALARLEAAYRLDGDAAQAADAARQAIAGDPRAAAMYGRLAADLAAAGDRGVLVFVNGRPVDVPTPPTIEEGRTLVPLGAVAVALGADTRWDPLARTLTVRYGAMQVTLAPGSRQATRDGLPVTLDVPPVARNGETLVPVLFVAEAFGLDVSWHPGGTGGGVVSILGPPGG